MRSTEEDEHTLVLEGTWADIPEGSPRVFAEPEHVILTQGGDQQAFPVKAIETAGDETLLRCSRNPRFTYDPDPGVLEETVFPLHRIEGRAEVHLPGRMWLQSSDGDWKVRTTDSISVCGRHIERNVTQ